MKKTLKGYFLGFLSAAVLVSGVTYAASTTKTIEALYNNIKIYVDGIKIDPKDAAGNAVEPFIYNGTTYLPVRAVGEAIGKTVSWDGETQSVYLDEKPGDTVYLLDVCPPYDGDFQIVSSNNGEYITIAGEKQTDAIRFGTVYAIDKLPVLFNLNGKYEHLSFMVGRLDGSEREDATLNIYLDDKLTKTYALKADGLPEKIEIDLNNALSMKIELANATYYNGIRLKNYAMYNAIVE